MKDRDVLEDERREIVVKTMRIVISAILFIVVTGCGGDGGARPATNVSRIEGRLLLVAEEVSVDTPIPGAELVIGGVNGECYDPDFDNDLPSVWREYALPEEIEADAIFDFYEYRILDHGWRRTDEPELGGETGPAESRSYSKNFGEWHSVFYVFVEIDEARYDLEADYDEPQTVCPR